MYEFYLPKSKEPSLLIQSAEGIIASIPVATSKYVFGEPCAFWNGEYEVWLKVSPFHVNAVADIFTSKMLIFN